jgi:hypothetical protein
MALDVMTFGIRAIRKTFDITALSIMVLGIMSLGITKNATLGGIMYCRNEAHRAACHYAECRCAEGHGAVIRVWFGLVIGKLHFKVETLPSLQ